MTLGRSLSVALVGLALGACADGEPSDPLVTSTSGSTSDADGPSVTTTLDPPLDTSAGTSAGSSSGPSTADDTSGDGSSSTDAGCPPGTEGCPCDAGTCEAELLCTGDVCQAPQCEGDVFEPNEDEASAFYLGMINDNDDNGSVVSGSLHYPGDVDWYRYQGDDDITGNVDPARDVVASAPVRVCKFLECDNGLGQTEFECPVGSDYALSPMARPGCCITSDADTLHLPDLNCTGVTEDNAAVYIRVDQPAGDCVSYSVSYHY